MSLGGHPHHRRVHAWLTTVTNDEFATWPENFSYTKISPTRLTGHRQIADSWLAELAKRKGGKLATLDEPLSALWPDSTLLVPV